MKFKSSGKEGQGKDSVVTLGLPPKPVDGKNSRKGEIWRSERKENFGLDRRKRQKPQLGPPHNSLGKPPGGKFGGPLRGIERTENTAARTRLGNRTRISKLKGPKGE